MRWRDRSPAAAGAEINLWDRVLPDCDPVHLMYVTVSMRVMSAGDGYRYLLRSVAAADGDRALSTPLTRYYAEEGTP